MKKYFLASLLGFVFGLNVHSQTSYTESIVRIYGYNSSSTKVGSGAFVDFAGKSYILTCYHNLSGCKKFEVFSSIYGQVDDVKIAAYDDVRDIILLSYTLKKGVYPKNLQLGQIPRNLSSIKGIAIGHPNSITEQKFEVRFTSENGQIPVKSLFDNSGRPIFNLSSEFNIIPIDLTIYGGMSGAPVIVNSFVIGILSGSVNTGGSIGWAIPIYYCDQLRILSKPLSTGLDLANLRSLNSGNLALARSVSLDEDFEDNYHTPLNDVMNDVEQRKNEYINAKTELNKKISVTINKIVNCVFENEQSHPFGYRQAELNEIDSLMALVDFGYTYSTSINEQLASEIKTFSEIFNKIYVYKKEFKITKEIGEKLGDRAGLIQFRLDELTTKELNKQTQKSSAGSTCSLWKLVNKDNYKTYCKDYLSLMMEENKYSIDLANAAFDKVKVLKIIADLAFEAKGFTDN
jgi:hypothetical protein